MAKNILKNEDNDTVKKVRDALRISYEYCRPIFEDAHYALVNYHNQIDERIWGTLSECPIPMAYSTVETMMPSIMDFHFGTSRPFALLNADGFRDETMKKLERYLYGKLLYEMKIKRICKPIMRDALILPCSYGIVERKSITPPSAEVLSGITAGGDTEQLFEMIPGEPTNVPSLRYLDFFSTFPAPVGATPDDVDYVVIIDFMDEFTIENGFKDKTLKGDFEQLKADAIMLMPYTETALHYAAYTSDPHGYKLPHDKQNVHFNKDLPVRIPVVKYYGKDERIWESGGQIIYRKKNKDVMGCPIIRFCAQQIGDTWYPQSILQFSSSMYNMINAWYNSLVDILSLYLYPTTISHKAMLVNQEQDVSYQPNLVIETTGDPSKVIYYPTLPSPPPAMLEFPRELRSMLDVVNGQPEAIRGGGGAGIVRGGSGALQSLLQRASARVMLVAESLEETGLQSVYEKVTLMLQMLGKGGVAYLDKNNEIIQETVTEEEIRQVLNVQLLGKKRMENKFADQLVKIQAMPMLVQMGFDPVKIVEWVFPEADIETFIGAMPPQIAAVMQQQAGQGGGTPAQMGDIAQQVQMTGGR